jgi:hypothetical protein
LNWLELNKCLLYRFSAIAILWGAISSSLTAFAQDGPIASGLASTQDGTAMFRGNPERTGVFPPGGRYQFVNEAEITCQLQHLRIVPV